MKALRIATLALGLALFGAGEGSARAGDEASEAQGPRIAEGEVDIVEQLGDVVPRDVALTDSAGRAVRFGDYLEGRPVVLAFVYHRCLSLCGLLLGGLTNAMRSLDDGGAGAWRVGKAFDVVTVSIDPDETPDLAKSSRDRYLQSLGRPEEDTRWAFLTGPAASIDALTSAVGFRFKYIEGQKQFAHAAALVVLTPEGKVSRYLYGVEPPPDQLKAALFEAAGGRVGTSFDRVIMRCLQWDPAARRYRLFLTTYYRGAGVVLLAGIGGLLAVLIRRDRRRARLAAHPKEAA